MTDTPRTNAQPVHPSRFDARIKCVNIEFAQELERELATVVNQRQSLRDQCITLKLELNEVKERLDHCFTDCSFAISSRDQWRTMAQGLAEILKATHSLRDCTPDCEIKIRLERFNKLNE